MPKLSISMPDSLYMKVKLEQGKYQTLSGFIAELLEKGLVIKEKEKQVMEKEIRADQ